MTTLQPSSGPTTSRSTRDPNDTVVEATDLSYNYGSHGEFAAVTKLSFSVRRGELYALLGTNGAGKTTTLETLEGHRTPTSGTVSVFGGAPTNRRDIRPRVGIMLQESGFAAELTVIESLRLGGSISGRADDADRLVNAVELGSKRDTRVGQLSGGERRRLDFAIAIWGTPELVFLDEPTTGLDPTARDRLWEIVGDLRSSGTTVILTTHYLEEAEKHADRIGLMHKGVLAQQGTLTELVAERPSRISFIAPSGVELPLPVRASENKLTVVETMDLQYDLTTLLKWAESTGVTLDRLSATPSSLEDVFRSLAAQ
ncbi:MAG TPA: ABC transporter ATP-binding protein [Glaciihabitans sp.]|nr:ABC transporter ATP-binding protein [Glaciihabitans sp.]